MTGSELQKSLTGQFSVWFATKRGREKPNALDKKDAEALASSTVDMFLYRVQFGAGGTKGANSEAGKEVLARLAS
jgi:hypothetical protein